MGKPRGLGWTESEKALILEAGRAGQAWCDVSIPGRSKKSLASKWNKLASDDDNLCRVNTIAGTVNIGAASRGRGKTLWFPRPSAKNPMSGKIYHDDPQAIRDRGSPGTFSPRAPIAGLFYGGASSIA